MATANGAVASTATRDRRSSARYNLLQHGDVVMVDFVFGEPALLVDLGVDGMRLQAVGVTPSSEESTSWSFDLPADGGRVEGAGTVIWSKEAGNFGVRFDRLVVGRGALEAWVAQKIGAEAAQGRPSRPALSSSDCADILAALAQEIQARHLSDDAALQMIVEQVGRATGASGAVVALEVNGAIVCRASYGEAPEVGTQVDPHSGLTGECVRSGQIVRCDDTETDPRVNTALCRAINLRSVAVVPMVAGSAVVGLVEAFSPSPESFHEPQIELLRGAADIMLDLITSPSAAVIPSHTAEPPLTESAPAPGVSETGSPGFETSRSLSLSDDEIAKLLEQANLGEAADDSSGAVIAARTTVEDTGINSAVDELASLFEQEVEPSNQEDTSGEPAPAQALDGKTSQVTATTEPTGEPQFALPRISLLAWVGARRFAVAIAAMTLVAIALAGYVIRSRLRSSVQQANVTLPATAPGPPTTTPAVSQIPPSPAPPSSNAPAASAEKPATATVKQVTNEAPATPATDIATSTPVLRQPAPPPPQQEEVAAPSPLGVAPTQGGSNVSSLLASSTTVPVRPVLVSSGGVTGGNVVSRIEPVYPPNARAMRLQGLVVLNVTVDISGKVVRIKPLSGHPVLLNAAELAVRQWKYEPFRVSGSPIQTDTTVRITFRLNGP